MDKREFLKRLGLGGIALGASIPIVEKVKDVIIENSPPKEINVPDELKFYLLKDGEVFHPIHKECKVNRNGEVSYINHNKKVFYCKLHKHKVTGQYAFRLKNTSVVASRFVYEAFAQIKLNQSYVIINKDGNSGNVSIDNLMCITKKSYDGYKIKQKRIIERDKKGRIITYS